ncbi:hypothetical protein QQ045_017966 [Rhodiola kirilowii]
MPGRGSMDSIALAHDLTCHINNGHLGGNVLIKLDMSKAYDRISWIFLLRMLKALGFNQKWCDLIYHNISNCGYSVLWDGSPFGHFKSNQGVRQGDPLSPSLFIICMEAFSRMLHHQVATNRIYPYFVKVGALVVNHLLYADDMLIFTNGSKVSIYRLLALIHTFCLHSGQLLNASKSIIFFYNNIPHVRCRTLLSIANFSPGAFPTTYLGAPLFPGRVKIEYFQALEDKVHACINGWTRNLLSMGGKVIIIASILNSMLTHVIGTLPTPATVISRISSLMASFLWNQKDEKRRH